MGKNKRKSSKHSKTSTALVKSKKGNKEAKARKKDTKMKLKYKHPKLALALKIILIALVILVVDFPPCVTNDNIAAPVLFISTPWCFSNLSSSIAIYGLWGDDLKINLSELVLKQNSVIYDTDGNVIAELTGDENRKIITLEEMSPYLPKAYIAIEDERFEKHHGQWMITIKEKQNDNWKP